MINITGLFTVVGTRNIKYHGLCLTIIVIINIINATIIEVVKENYTCSY